MVMDNYRAEEAQLLYYHTFALYMRWFVFPLLVSLHMTVTYAGCSFVPSRLRTHAPIISPKQAGTGAAVESRLGGVWNVMC